MSRLVELKTKEAGRRQLELAGGETGVQEKLKEYGERVAKYVPAEVLAFYTAAVQLIMTKEGDENTLFRLWAFAVIGVIAWAGTPLYLSMFSSNPKERGVNQIMASIAFIIWAYAYPAGLFAELNFHEPVIAGLVLMVFSFVSAFIQPKE
ncbi:MAG: hypothetical protein HGA62_06980 [Chlorobiaceae bacterium]|nr:hypothetical protein [Chlorobiaceae bacterium]NTV61539.1 hypothetical protein [Chlorobiaceae bacterium]